jgi:hypothetical protein
MEHLEYFMELFLELEPVLDLHLLQSMRFLSEQDIFKEQPLYQS